jgi:hypothetical protein
MPFPNQAGKEVQGRSPPSTVEVGWWDRHSVCQGLQSLLFNPPVNRGSSRRSREVPETARNHDTKGFPHCMAQNKAAGKIMVLT